MTVDLFGLGNTFRAMSPFQQAVNLAHQAARQRLEAGGAPAPAAKPGKKPGPILADFTVPADIDAAEVATAIQSKLREQGGLFDQPVLQRRAGGRVVVPAAHLLRLGDGRFEKGRRFVQGLVREMRARRARIRTRLPARRA